MMTQHNKVAARMIYHPLLMISILIVTLLASTNLSITAPFIAGLSLSPSWTVASRIFQPINHRLKVVAPYTWKLFMLTVPIHH